MRSLLHLKLRCIHSQSLKLWLLESRLVATASPGITDIVDNRVTGLLATTEMGGLSNAIVRIVLDHKLRHRMGKAARKASRQYCIQNTV